MIVLQAGYIVDEIIDLFDDKADVISKIKQSCFFELHGLENESLTIENPEQITSVIFNIISRGTPTRASKFLIEKLLFRLSILENDNDIKYTLLDPQTAILKDNYFLDKPQLKFQSNDDIVAAFIKIAQIQKVLLLLFLTKQANIYDGTITISTVAEFEDILKVAVEDILKWHSVLCCLAERKQNPQIEIKPRGKNKCNIDISFSEEANEFGDINIELRPTKSEPISNRYITTEKIQYPTLGEAVEIIQNEKRSTKFEFNVQHKEEALLYILHSVFRKRNFRAGQLPIINKAIQNEDVIGLLPTGGGKSLTYQLVALLQPCLTIIVDPINSLMRDQYEKLIEYFIDASAYINSYNTDDERKINENKLQKGGILYAFISPERLQIQKFRNILLNCKSNGVYFGYAVIDEAHCVSEWGHDFRQTYLRLADNLKSFCPTHNNSKLTLFGLTATASFDVLADIERELGLIGSNAIQSLPPEQIDRKELNFNLVKIESVDKTTVFWKREKANGKNKYPEIKRLLKNIPKKLNGNNDFYSPNATNLYPNAGIVFCPTKSDTIGNGVLALKKGYFYEKEFISGLEDLDILNIATFFSGGDSEQSENVDVESEALHSFDNQTKFINSEVNLMLATKAFGMGIDKPNIRFTIHYSTPSSVESFYQEAGRAGRDRQNALCSILYCDADIQTNLDFLNNSFKGLERERAILEELLTEIKYEDKFFLNFLKNQLKTEFDEAFSVSLWPENAPSFLFIGGEWNANPDLCIKYGALDINTLALKYKSATKDWVQIPNVESNEEKLDIASKRLAFAKKVILDNCSGSNYSSWLSKKTESGIEAKLKDNPSGAELIIGFRNDVIAEIAEKIKNDGNEFITERLVRAAYNFCDSPDQFLKDLDFEYNRAKDFKHQLNLQPLTEEFIKKAFWKIRNSSDTQRAIYRLTILGIIDDYTIDYAGQAIIIKFSAKSKENYFNRFSAYLLRYVGEETKNTWLDRARNETHVNELRGYLFILSEFVYAIIEKKRRTAINYMDELCQLGIEKGDIEFRTNIIYYFTSKFARNDYLPRDTENENLEAVFKYLDFIKSPPDGLGGEIDNIKHLKGAIERVRVSLADENATISLLSAFVEFILETYSADLDLSNTKIQKAISEYKQGFSKFYGQYDFNYWSDSVFQYNDILTSINPRLKTLTDVLSDEIFANHHHRWLNTFNNSFIDIKF